MVKKKKGRIIGAVLVVVLIAAVIVLCRCLSLAFTDNIKDKYTLTEKADTFLETVLKGAVSGDDFELSEEELNSYINDKYCTPYSKDRSGLDHIRFYFHDNEPSEMYAHIYTRGYRFAVHSKVTFSINSATNIVTAKLFDAYIGELNISDNILSYILSKVFDDKDNIYLNGTTIGIAAKYAYEIKSMNIELCLTGFNPEEGVIICRTNNLTGEALKAVGEYITSDEGKEALSNLYNKVKDKVISIFE